MDLNYSTTNLFPTIIHQFDVNDFDEEQIIFNKDQDILDSITYDGNSNHILKSVKIERPYGVFCCGTKVI